MAKALLWAGINKPKSQGKRNAPKCTEMNFGKFLGMEATVQKYPAGINTPINNYGQIYLLQNMSSAADYIFGGISFYWV